MSENIRSIPLAHVERMAIVLGKGRSLAEVKQAVGCDCIINGGLYDMGTGKPVSHLKVDGQVLAKEGWGSWGYAWTDGPDLEMLPIPDGAFEKANAITCLPLLTPWDGMDAPLSYPAALGGARGRTAMAVAGDKLMLYCSGDGTADARTPEQLRQRLHGLGAQTALMLDSGGSSQCDFGAGAVIRSGRRVHNYICVWVKKNAQTPDNNKEETPMETKYTVCLDPGHGPGCVNGSPDGRYKEQEFTWDMAGRIRPLLEAQGVKVVLTRSAETWPGLTARAKVSNDVGADLFVSLHSNAANNNGWSEPSGLMIFTSSGGDSAGRNRAAKAILTRMQEAGVALFGGGLAHSMFTVLAATNAPACLIEYGFHTNQGDVALLETSVYRDKLAKVTVAGICDYLGVAQRLEDQETGTGDAVADWAAEAWDWCVREGLLDGSRPADAVTRQELAIVLARLDARRK